MSSREIPNIHYFNRNDFLEDAQWTAPLKTDIDKLEIIKDLNTTFLTFGSCFAVNLKKVLNRFGFDVHYERDGCNHYSTDSLHQLLERLKDNISIDDDSLYSFNETGTDVVAYEYFGVRYYGDGAKQKCISHAKKIDETLKTQIKKRDVIIITLGTSLSFRHQNGKVISALKGMPLDICSANLQSVDDIKNQLSNIYRALVDIRGNNYFKLIFTVSPQRYNWQKEFCGKGFLQYHNISKSTLLLAVNSFVDEHKDRNAIYFPSYELVMDELRLYESLSTYDHLHVNQDLTPKYVVKRFLNTFASDGVVKSLIAMENLRFLIYFTKERQEFGASLHSEFIAPQWDKFLRAVKQVEKDYQISGLLTLCVTEMDRLAIFDQENTNLQRTTTSVLADYSNHKKLENKIIEINALAEEQKVVIYGASEICDTLMKSSSLLNKKLIAIVDQQFKEKTTMYGLACYPPSELINIPHDVIIICSQGSFGLIQDNIRAMNINSPCI